MKKVRSLSQEELSTKFSRAALRTLGELSIDLGRLHWQNDVGIWENQVAILLLQQKKLTQLISDIVAQEVL